MLAIQKQSMNNYGELSIIELNPVLLSVHYCVAYYMLSVYIIVSSKAISKEKINYLSKGGDRSSLRSKL